MRQINIFVIILFITVLLLRNKIIINLLQFLRNNTVNLFNIDRNFNISIILSIILVILLLLYIKHLINRFIKWIRFTEIISEIIIKSK